jgi:peptidoglycan/xylan/chitin deacetylase (PgdA/CDA1 family)
MVQDSKSAGESEMGKSALQVRVPILYYHRVDEDLSPSKGVTPRAFAAQMEYLRRKNYSSILFDDLADYFRTGRPLPNRPIIISFDDGYLDNFSRAFPILKQCGFTATIFLVSDYIGKQSDWEGCAGRDVVPLMTREHISLMMKDGFHFGGHGRIHRNLVDLPEEDARREVEGGRKDLEDLLQRPVRSFAYPFGNFNERVAEIVKTSGFASARTIHTDNTHTREDLYRLKCVKVNGMIPMYKFKYYLTGFYHLETIWQARRKNERID